MKTFVILAALATTAVALPAAAQNWYDPATLVRNSYVEAEGGISTEGRTRVDINGGSLGTSSQSTSQSHDGFGGALVGVNVSPYAAVELEGVYYQNNLGFSPTNSVLGQGGKVQTFGGLANLKLEAPYRPSFGGFQITPYIAAGAGYGRVRFTGQNGIFAYVDKDPGFMWQAKAGVEVKTGPHWALDVTYRYIRAPDDNIRVNYNYSALARTEGQIVSAGIKYNF